MFQIENNTLTRVIVGLIGIPLIVFLVIRGNEVLLILCVILSLFCMNEFYNLFETPKSPPSKLTKWAGGFSVYKSSFLLVSSLIVISLYYVKFNYVLILYFLMFLYLIIVEVFKTKKHYEAVGTWLLSILYISTPFGLLSLMGSSDFIKLFGANFALICLILVWVSDTFAFWGGKTFGKHKLAEKISPKKTWEGSLFGFTFTIIGGIIITFLYPKDFALLQMIVIAVIIGIFAQLGDLFESQIKRSVSRKDSSQLIPGHGGFLDRFDSILFSVPALYIFLYLVSTFK